MHAILVSADSSLSGQPRHVADLAIGLTDVGNDVSVIAPPGPIMQELRATHKIETINLPFRSRFDLKTVWQLRKLFKAVASNPNVVIHAHGLRAGLLARLAAFRLNLPLVYTEHLWTADYQTTSAWRRKEQVLLLRLLDRKTAHTIAVSNAVAQFLLANHITQKERLSVIYHGLRQIPPPAHTRPGQTPIIGFVGALNRTKRLDVLIRACGLLKHNEVNFKLEIVGRGPEKTAVLRLIRDLDLSSHTIFLGQLNDVEVAMADWSIVAIPSDSESFSLVALLAEAMGLPVVATDVGGLPEVVSRSTGFLVSPHDPPAMERALAKLLTDPALRQKLGAAGRQHAKTFSFEKMINQTRSVYDQVLAHRHQSLPSR